MTRNELARLRRQMHRRIRVVVAERRVGGLPLPEGIDRINEAAVDPGEIPVR
jgi:hypothetical protein